MTRTNIAEPEFAWDELLVLSGNPTLFTPDGEERLKPWDVAVFRRDPERALSRLSSRA